jgi:hypothetical protein
MKKALITGLILFSFGYLQAQMKAITESGDEVLLNQDGTWIYTKDKSAETKAIKINDHNFSKSNKSSFLVKSKKLNIGIWMDPKEWKFQKAPENEAAEFQFQKKDEDIYAMLISEKIEVPIEKLKEIAFSNAQGAAPDVVITQEEYRNVNGIQVLMMQMTGTIQGIKFVYFGYYYSNTNGTIQFLTYTSQNLFQNYKEDMEDLLNGFVVVD